MKSKFVKTVYEKNGFCIYVYVTEDETVPQAARSNYYKGPGYEFTAIGNNLPANKLEVDLHGAWDKNNHGLQFKVDYYEEIRPQSVEGIESYLASGMVKGIGPKTAKLIVAKYGTRTFEILDDYPESLLDIKGITRKNWIRLFWHIRTVMQSGIWQHILPHLRLHLRKSVRFMSISEMRHWMS